MSRAFSKETLEIISEIRHTERYLEDEIREIQETKVELTTIETNLASCKERLQRLLSKVETYENKIEEYKKQLTLALGLEALQPVLPLVPGQCYVGDGSLAELEKVRADDTHD